jgi:hypothetical protein
MLELGAHEPAVRSLSLFGKEAERFPGRDPESRSSSPHD